MNQISTLTRLFVSPISLIALRPYGFVLFAMFISFCAQGQVATNGGSGLAPTYPTLAAAITALNAATITSPVIITLTGNETAPVGGYSITAAGTSTNTITIQGSASTLTAFTPQTSGNLTDAIFKLIGADWITITSFTMLENAANTTTAAATNNMTEWGVALLYATTTNGSQNNTIQSNTIDLNRTYQNTFGIYSNSTHSATVVTTAATATGAGGGNSGLKIYSNTITDVNLGVVVVGPLAAADYNNIIDVGGTSAATGNTINNYGTTNVFSGYVNVSGTVNAVLVRNSTSINISYNNITSSNGGTTAGTLRAIYIPSFTVTPTGTFTHSINNNTIALTHGVSTTLQGITVETTTGTATSTQNINNNNFTALTFSVTSSGATTAISDAMANLTTNINGNTFTNISTNTTGAFTFISHSFSMPASGITNVNNNSIATAFTRTGAGSTTITTTNGSSPNGSSAVYSGNNFSNITVTGSSAITGISNTDGAGSSPSKEVTSNTFNNWSGGTGAFIGITVGYIGANTSTISNNTVTNLTSQGALTGITVGSSFSGAVVLNLENNVINNLISTGTGGTVTGLSSSNTSTTINILGNGIHTLSSSGASSTVFGISVTGATTTNVFNNTINSLSGSGATSPLVRGISISGGTTVNVYQNKIYDLSESAAITTTNSAVNGILLSGGTTVNAYNNLIGDLKAPTANLVDAIRGISITSSTASSTLNVSYNTIYLNATSTGTNFGSSGVFHTTSATATTATLNLRNNVIVNLSTANGSGFTAVHRRSSNVLTNYGAASNNNLLYAGTPSASRLIFYDGTNSDQSLAAYKTRVTPRDAVSVTENPDFLSTTGSTNDFLHIDPATPTQIESAGVAISGITTDYDGETRNGTTPDIGADEGAFVLADVSGPSITYTQLGNTLCLTAPTLTATITDASGVNVSSGTKPRLYFKKLEDANTVAGNTNADNGWKYVEASNAASPFNFTFDYSLLLSPVIATDTIQYFIVAQDLSAAINVGMNSGIFTNQPVSVALTSAAFPITGTINKYAVFAAIASNVTVGTGGTYTTLTDAGGLFAAINAGGLSTNTVATILGNITETGAVGLNQILYDCAGSVTLTIVPAASTSPILSGSSSTALININGADNVIIDGSNNATNSKNLTISNTSTGGATIRFINDASNNTVKNSILTGVTTSTANGVLFFSTTNGTSGNDNITIQNNDISGGSTSAAIGIYNLGTGTTSTTKNSGLVINDNRIFNFSTVGIRDGGNSVGTTYTKNEIFEVATQTTALQGFNPNATSIEGFVFSRNKIYDLKTSSTTSVYGIYLFDIAGTPNVGEISNNFIAISETAPLNVKGIYDNSATTEFYNIYFNSISLTGTVTGASNSEAYYRSVASNTNLKNNILVNTRSGGTGKHYGIRTLATLAGFVSDYNDIYVGTGTGNVFGNDGTADRVDLAAWQGATTLDLNSETIQPNFTSAIDLHLVTTNNALLDNQGTTISGITTDIDNNTRSATPDIGADEYTAVIGVDVGATALVSPAAGGCYTAAETVTVTIKNFSVSTIDFAVNNVTVSSATTGPVTYSSNVVLNSGTLAGGASMNVTLPLTINMTAQGTYVFTNSATVSGDLNTSNDNLIVNRVVLALGGTYTVGSGGNYTTLTAAIADYNVATCFTSNVIFELTDASYSTAETFPIVINENSFTSSLIIRPASNQNSTLTGSSTTSLLKLNGADNITIDGSNNGTSTRNLTMVNTNTATTGNGVIWLASATTSNGATNNTIKNVIVTGNSSTTTLMGIFAGGTASIGTSTSALTANSGNSILNNKVSKTQYGIYLRGTSVTTLDANNNISQNILGSSTAGDGFALGGVTMQFQTTGQISFNDIQNIANSTTSSNLTGINLQDATSSSVFNNAIHFLRYTASTTGKVYGITTSTSTFNIVGNQSANSYYNNFVYDLSSTATSTSWNVSGINNNGGYNDQYNFNSVYLTGQLSAATGGSAAFSNGNGLTAAASPVINIRNNIFAVNASSTAAANLYAHYTTLTTYSGSTINNNDLYTIASGTAIANVGRFNAINYTDLASWQVATSMDGVSISADPLFASSTDLHLNNSTTSPAESAGIPISGITTDYDVEPRNATTPDIGGDEYTLVTCTTADGGTASVSGASSYCGSGSPSITASGYSTGSGSGYQWMTSTNAGDFPGSGAPVAAQTNPASLTPGSISTTTHFWLKVTCSTGMTTDYSNIVTITINPVPTTDAGSNSPICAGGSLNLTGTTDIGTIFSWTGPNSFTSTNQNPSINNATTLATGNYTFQASTGICSSSDIVSVTVNHTPATPVVLPATICSGGTATLTVTNPINDPSITGTKIGTGASVSSVPGPYRRLYGGHRMQMLYTAAELSASGITAGQLISLSFYVNTVPSGSTLLGNVEIKLKNTSTTTLTSTFETGGTSVYTAGMYQPIVGINTHTFNGSVFTWDGSSNLLIDFCFNNSDAGGVSTATEYTTVTSSVSGFPLDNSATVCTNATGTVASLRPNIRLERGGVGVATYTWNPGALTGTSVMVSPASTTTYTVTGAFATGCSSESEVVVTVEGSVVTNINDSGSGSLRNVIACVASGSTITFAAGLSGQTITLTSGEISIAKNLTISGLGAANLTISGNNASRIFHLTTGNDLEIENISLKDGSSTINGGAIHVQGDLILDNVILQNNSENGSPKSLTISGTATLEVIGNVEIRP